MNDITLHKLLLEQIQLLLEARIDFLEDKYVLKPEEKTDGKKLNKRDFDKLAEVDPTKTKESLEWLIRKYLAEKGDNPRQWWEDSYKITEALELFSKVKKSNRLEPNQKDINQYKTTSDFIKTMGTVADKLTTAEKEAGTSWTEKYKALRLPGEAPGGFLVWMIPQAPTLPEQRAEFFKQYYPISCDLGSGTKWCTATGKTDNWFRVYTKKSPLYIFLSKTDPNERYQIHYNGNSTQVMDILDEPYKGKYVPGFINYIAAKTGNIPPDTLGEFMPQLDPIDKLSTGNEIYKVGPKYYLKIGNSYAYLGFDKKVKDQNNMVIDPKALIKQPLIAFVSWLLDKGEAVDGLTKLLTGNAPDAPEGKNYTINGGLNLEGAEFTKLPNGMHIKGNVSLADSRIQEIPNNFKVDGDLDLTGTKLQPKADTEVAGEILR